jgi:hypothetical protein
VSSRPTWWNAVTRGDAAALHVNEAGVFSFEAGPRPDTPTPTPADLHGFVSTHAGTVARARLDATGDVSFVVVDGPLRFRVHALRAGGGLALQVRAVDERPLPLDDVGLSADLVRELPRAGLCVIAGPARSGRSTTRASLVQALAAERSVLSLEDPVEIPLRPAGHALVQEGIHDDGVDLGRRVTDQSRARTHDVASFDATAVAMRPSWLAHALVDIAHHRLAVVTATAARTSSVRADLVCSMSGPARARDLERIARYIHGIRHQRRLPAREGMGAVFAAGWTAFDARRRNLFAAAADDELDADVEARPLPGDRSLSEALVGLVRDRRVTLQSALAASPVKMAFQDRLNRAMEKR